MFLLLSIGTFLELLLQGILWNLLHKNSVSFLGEKFLLKIISHLFQLLEAYISLTEKSQGEIWQVIGHFGVLTFAGSNVT